MHRASSSPDSSVCEIQHHSSRTKGIVVFIFLQISFTVERQTPTTDLFIWLGNKKKKKKKEKENKSQAENLNKDVDNGLLDSPFVLQ